MLCLLLITYTLSAPQHQLVLCQAPPREPLRITDQHPHGRCQFIGGSIVVVIVLSSLRRTRLNGLMRMRRARYFFFRVVPNVLPASQCCDATLSE